MQVTKKEVLKELILIAGLMLLIYLEYSMGIIK